ncbi:uncharacterized protein LOC135132703 [Zophobas morio]|uniref:uncharacterized protein LOC135132703 n=1 Tax=Zophobas morio TaxID=2755281 RepID=UPI003082B063
MKILTVFLVVMFFTFSEALKNYKGTEIQKCLNCLCHARTGCYSRFNCASYSVNIDYWKFAKSPVVDIDDEPETEQSYKKCMRNENCILTTIDQYADAVGHMDCNCDGAFDCKDRFAIHLFGLNCTNPKFEKWYVDRFNTCAKEVGVNTMLENEGFDGCTPEVV